MIMPNIKSTQHKVLSADFCSGYTDVLGHWNTGFECPATDSADAVFCCGNEHYKYCCTKSEENVTVTEEVINLPLILGVTCGVMAAVIIIIAISCFYCSFCLLYKKRKDQIAAESVYNMNAPSSTSELTNMYSSYDGSRSSTPDTNHSLYYRVNDLSRDSDVMFSHSNHLINSNSNRDRVVPTYANSRQNNILRNNVHQERHSRIPQSFSAQEPLNRHSRVSGLQSLPRSGYPNFVFDMDPPPPYDATVNTGNSRRLQQETYLNQLNGNGNVYYTLSSVPVHSGRPSRAPAARTRSINRDARAINRQDVITNNTVDVDTLLDLYRSTKF